MSETVKLSDLQNRSRKAGVTSIDLTGSTPVVTQTPAEPAVEEPVKPKVTVEAVQTGPVNASDLRPVNIDAILPKRETAPSALEQSLYKELDMAVDRTIGEIDQLHKDIYAKQEEELEQEELAREEEELAKEDEFAISGTSSDSSEDEDDDFDTDSTFIPRKKVGIAIEDDIDEEEDTDEVPDLTVAEVTPSTKDATPVVVEEAPVPTETPVQEEEEVEEVETPTINITPMHTSTPVLDHMKDEDLFDDEDEVEIPTKPTKTTEEEEKEANDMLESLKSQINERVIPIKKSFDLSKFTVAKKAISAQKVMKLAIPNQNAADWIMPAANRPISVSGLSGPEILKLNPQNSNRNRMNTFRDMYRIIYDHVIDGNKPDFEAWLKHTRFVDLQHIYFALYMATFGGSNFASYSCPKCNKVFIKDIDLKDMVVYANDEAKKAVNAMLKMDTTTPTDDEYEVELYQVSDQYVFGIRTPSVWNVIIETASLSEDFLEKYADQIDLVAYVDSAYLIDGESQTLIPIDTKPVPNDMAKTAARRIKAIYQIINSLSSEDFYALRNKIGKFDEASSLDVSYKIPGCNCPHCATPIPDNTEITTDSMLFTRHQLVLIGTM